METDVRHTFDVPVKMRVRGALLPASATVLHIAISGCRLRASALMERGTALSFEWRLADGRLLTLAGVVAARYPTRNGAPGYEYAIALEPLAPDDSDALQKEAE